MSTTFSKEIKAVEEGIKKSFGRVREELDDHLETINQNTAEIQSLYEYLVSLEKKMDKLSEHIEELRFIPSHVDPIVADLTLREQEVFLALYASDSPLLLEDLSSRLGFASDALERYVANLIQKNIPVLRHAQNTGVFFSLELRFKELQTRKNLVKIDSRISEQLTAEKII